MECERCGSANPDFYKFCGKCGATLPIPVSVGTTSNLEPARAIGTRETEHPVILSGPSFLGLNTDSETDSASYLLDDETPSHHGGRTMLLVAILLFFAAAGYFGYRNFYVLPTFAETLPPPRVPGFAYEHTPPEALGNSEITADSTFVPNRKLIDNLAIENISAEMRKTSEQEKLTSQKSTAEENVSPSDRLLAEGEKYLYGRGVMTNCKVAVKNFEAAAKQNNASAMAHLGSLYASGRCVRFNRIEAYQWFAKAKNADPNNHWLEASMDMLWRNMNHHERTAILQ